MKESAERALYRQRCKFHSLITEQCYKKSISDKKSYIAVACTADCVCERMKRYDKLKGGK